MNPGGGSCSEPRLQDCTPAWATEQDSVSKKKKSQSRKLCQKWKRRRVGKGKEGTFKFVNGDDFKKLVEGTHSLVHAHFTLLSGKKEDGRNTSG